MNKIGTLNLDLCVRATNIEDLWTSVGTREKLKPYKV